MKWVVVFVTTQTGHFGDQTFATENEAFAFVSEIRKDSDVTYMQVSDPYGTVQYQFVRHAGHHAGRMEMGK